MPEEKANIVDETYQALGEFIVVFQWVENLYRQIGWFILDPERMQWPPMPLRKETNHQLIERVSDLFAELTKRHAFPNGKEKAKVMLELRSRFHELRQYRNRLLHSTYIEIKSGGRLHGYIRSNPEIGVDPDSGEIIYDEEPVSADLIHRKMREYEEDMMQLNLVHVQLIHWYPFTRFEQSI